MSKNIFLLLLVVSRVAMSDAPTWASDPEPNLASVDAKTDWPWWRGPTRDGIAATGQAVPLTWDAETNVVWRTPILGRGHSSPTVVGSRVFLTTADEATQTQWVLCLERSTGKLLWQRRLHEGGFDRDGHKRNSQASATPATDGELLFVNFLSDKAIHVTALGLDGDVVWQRRVCDYQSHQGFGASPTVYGDLVLIAADHKGGGALMALDKKTGNEVWKHSRPMEPNYPSPVVLKVNGRDQLLMSGCNLVSGFDPLTGEKIWETKGSTTECVTSSVTNGRIVFASGGYPDNHMVAFTAGPECKQLWKNNSRVYVPSMLVHGDYLYSVTDPGVANCHHCETGELTWKQRLGGTFNASLVMVGDHIMATNEGGETFVYKASPDKYTEVAKNELGDQVFATPVICDNKIYHRVASKAEEKKHQEYLYCLGTE